MRCLCEQLRAQADSEHRHVQIEQPLPEEVLLAQPRMVLVLIGMHGASEHEHRAVRVEGTRQRFVRCKASFLELGPALPDDVAHDTQAYALAMDDCQDV